jgi:type II secretory pathway pseudopilin PulG
MVALAVIAFLVTFLMYSQQKKRRRKAENALEVTNEALAGIQQIFEKKALKEEAAAEKSAKVEVEQTVLPADPVQYNLPTIRAGLDFNVRPMPAPYPKAVRLQAWHNNGSRYVEVIYDPEAKFGNFRVHEVTENTTMAFAGPAWVFRLHNDVGGFMKETYLPVESESAPEGKRIADEVKMLLKSDFNKPSTNEPNPETTDRT